MAEKKSPEPLLRVAGRPAEQTFSHPLNPNSEMNWVTLSDSTGMQRCGVHMIRLRPGKESAIYHTHTQEEEWVYILSGRGIAEIDDRELEVGPGDFMGFPTPSVGHHMRNDSDEDLVYLVGGERKPMEIAEFPKIGKVVIRSGRAAEMVDKEQLQRFWPPEEPDETSEV
jgi:uncharacterized cupin superfamily protein